MTALQILQSAHSKLALSNDIQGAVAILTATGIDAGERAAIVLALSGDEPRSVRHLLGALTRRQALMVLDGAIDRLGAAHRIASDEAAQ